MTWAHGRHPAGRMPQDGSWKMVRCRMRCRRGGRCKTAAAGRTATEGPPPGCHRTGCRGGQEPAAGPFASGRSSLSASAPGAGLPVPVPSVRQGLRPSPCCRDTGPGPRPAALGPAASVASCHRWRTGGDICLFRARHRCTAWRFPSLPAVTARPAPAYRPLRRPGAAVRLADCRDCPGLRRTGTARKKRAGKSPALACDGGAAERYTSLMSGAPAMGLRARARKEARQTTATTTPMMSAVWMLMPKPILGS